MLGWGLEQVEFPTSPGEAAAPSPRPNNRKARGGRIRRCFMVCVNVESDMPSNWESCCG